MTKKIKRTKQLNAILKAISAWAKAEDAEFVGSFISFDKDCEIKDNVIVGWGEKKSILFQLDGMKKYLKEDKADFINW